MKFVLYLFCCTIIDSTVILDQIIIESELHQKETVVNTLTKFDDEDNHNNIISEKTSNFVCNETTLIDKTFKTCMNTTSCRSKFVLSETSESDKHFFDYIVEQEMMHVMLLSDTEICASNETFNMWISILSFYQFCYANEVLDPDVGCICKVDKTCNIMLSDKFGFTSIIQAIGIIVTLIVVLYLGVVIIRQLHEIQKKIIENSKKKLEQEPVNLSEITQKWN